MIRKLSINNRCCVLYARMSGIQNATQKMHSEEEKLIY